MVHENAEGIYNYYKRSIKLYGQLGTNVFFQVVQNCNISFLLDFRESSLFVSAHSCCCTLFVSNACALKKKKISLLC